MSYYESANLKRIPDLVRLAPDAAAAFLTFEHEVYQKSNHIPLKTKELIAIAVSHVTGCPYCIDVHVKKFKELGGTQEEIFEAVLTAAATRAGAILSHATHSLISYEGGKGPGKPDCFC
jgi:AhpD family alkylhydroperoxidase